MSQETFDLVAFQAKREAARAKGVQWECTVYDVKNAYAAGDANLRDADLRGADLRGANLSDADLRGATLSSADLRDADLSGADLSSATLSSADLRDATLRDADLRGATLSDADLSGADLSSANLCSADLSSADLSSANLRDADLSSAKGVLSSIDYMDSHFESNETGYIVYKTFSGQYNPPATWIIEPNSVISEVPNPLPTIDCGSGINVAPLSWVRTNYPNKPTWKCLIEWKWLVGVIVPYHTDGKIRCERVRLIEIVENK